MKTEMPKSLEECMKTDELAEKIWEWSETLKKYGKWIFWGLIIVGIIISFSSSLIEEYNYYYDIETNFYADIFFISILTWSIYAILEYCLYNAISLLLSALASIVQNTKVNTAVSLYNASKNAIDDVLENEDKKRC